MQRKGVWILAALVVLALAVATARVPGGLGGAAQAAPAPPGAPGSPVPVATTVPPGAEVVPGQVVVRLHVSDVEGFVASSDVQSALSSAGITATVQQALLTPGTYVLEVPAGKEAAAAAALASDPQVASADPNLVRHVDAAPVVIPNDPFYPLQWAWPRINAPAGWAAPQKPGVVVAVLDTGLDLGHPEFAGRVVPGANFVNPGQPPQDDNGHGTHVTGLIAAAGNNGVGGVGLAWQAQIMPIKVADSAGNLTSAAWIDGLQYAAKHGAQVANLSFGGPTFSSTEQGAIADAWDAGLVVVSSAGNSGDKGNPLEYPASYESALSVAATGNDNSHAYYSETNSRVALAAPGGDAHFGDDPPDRFVLSTWPINLASNFQTGYQREVGTSQSAAFVSGLAALLLATGPGWTNVGVVQRMEASATDLGPPGRDDSFGYGLINVAAALAGTQPLPTSTPPAPPPPIATPPAPTLPPASPTPPPGATPGLPPAATPTPRRDCLYADVCAGDWYLPFVQDLARRGAITGFGDRTFRPDASLIRGQALKMLVLAANIDLQPADAAHFADVPPTDPVFPYLETAVGRGVVAGYRDASFHPYAPISRGELAKLIVLALGWPFADPPVASFRDVPYGSTFYFYVETVAQLDIMPGFPDATFRPDLAISRADASRIVDLAVATYRPGSGSP